MNTDGISKLIEAVSKLTGVTVWPIIIIFVIIRFGRDFSNLISSIGDVTLKFAGFEASANIQSNFKAALTAAIAVNSQKELTPEAAELADRETVRVFGDINLRRIRQIEGSRVLWVDDQPNNNVYERRALEVLGVKFVIATSTDEALQKANLPNIDAIISDMSRPPDNRAGYNLLERLRSLGNNKPYIIYASLNSQDLKDQAMSRGAIGSTNSPTELVEMVLSVLSDS
jgi:CheY-like chemotaxis protein